MPAIPNILKHRLTYAYPLLAFLLVLNFFSMSQAIFLQQEWTSVMGNTLHFVLCVMALVCIVAADVKTRRTGPAIQETPRNFGVTFIIGASWFFIVVSMMNPPLDNITMLLMTIYFTKGAAIEELVFRYAFPRMLWVEGYGYWSAQFISNGLFSMAHFFVWQFSIATWLIGLAFGFAQMLAFTYGRSFMAIIWGHAVHNLALVGCNWWFLAFATGVILIVAVVKHETA